MLNRASNSLTDDSPEGGLFGFAWQVDRYPLVRLGLLFVALVVPLIGIGWRVAQLQFRMASVYAAEFSQLTTRVEEIPTLDGRILTSDGQTAAEDVPGLEVHVHYRWIEEPVDPRWLKQKALARIPRAERRKAGRLQSEMQKLADERETEWQNLARITGVSLEELQQRRRAIQARINHMKNRVEANRLQAARDTETPAPVATTWQGRLQQTVVQWVTQPPENSAPPEIVLQEELAYYPIVQYPVIEDIPPTLRAQLKSHPELYPNLRVIDVTRREYPLGPVAAHVVGFRKPLTEEEWKARQSRMPEGDPFGYQPGDQVGQTGIEKFHERHLKGVRGLRKLWINSQGEVVEEREMRVPKPGQDLELTLHIPLQKEAERLLHEAIQPSTATPFDPNLPATAAPTIRPRSGCIAVMDVRSGELLVAASWPTFDINVYLNGTPAERHQIEADSNAALYPRLHKMTLPPGSVFKALTATAMLQAGMRGDESFECQGYLDTPDRRRCLPFVHQQVGHGPVDLSLALAQSCNVYFYSAARRMGAKKLLSCAAEFGFGQPTGIDLPGESSGNLPPVRCDHLGVAIGQASLTVTPLQVLRMMAAIANGGELLTPRLARRSGSAVVPNDQDQGSVTDLLATPPGHSISNLSPHVLEQVRHGLELVVAFPRGTGYKTIRMSEVRIAGKTGTAEANGGPDHAWFAGYVPANRPKYALVVVLERGGSGGKVAGPVAKKLVEAILREELITPQNQLTQLAD